MRKYNLIIVLGIVLLLYASLVSANPYDTGLINYWDMEAGILDSKGSGDAVIIEADPSSSGCINGNCYDWSNDKVEVKNMFTFGNGVDFTLNFWINWETAETQHWIFGNYRPPSTAYSGLVRGVSGKMNFYGAGDTATGEYNLDTDPNLNNMMMMTIAYDGDLACLYINNTLDNCLGYAGVDDEIFYYIGGGDNTSFTFDGKIDEFAIFDRNLTLSEVGELWNDGTGLFYSVTPPAPSNTLNLSSTLPLNATQFNVPIINFNLTANASNQFNCSIYINDTINVTSYEHSAGSNVFLDFNVTFADDEEGTFNYLVGCWDGLNDTNTTKVEVVYVDQGDPTITTTFANGSIYFQNLLTGQFNFSDGLMLFSYNISIDGTSVDQLDQLNTTSYVYNLSQNISSYFVGVHNLTVKIADGHTAKYLKGDYGVSDGWFNSYLKYNFYDGGYARIDSVEGSIFDTFTTKREFDRYTFNYDPFNKNKNKYEFEITSDRKIFIVNKENSKYGSWVIIDNHWLDFVMDEESVEKVSFKRINDKKVQVTIKGIKDKELMKFSSIGDLNIVEQNFTFITLDATPIYSDPVIELTSQTFTLRLNKTTGVTTDSGLFWNGAVQDITKTLGTYFDTYTSSFITPNFDGETNVSFYWNYSLTGEGENENGTLTFQQTIKEIGIDNCSTFTTVAINITVLNETSDSIMTDNSSSVEGYFKIWSSSEDNFTEFNLTWGNDPNANYGLCIDPPGASYTINAQLEYDATGFEKKLYYFNDYTIDNSTETLNLYLADSTTQVTFTVKDFDDSAVPSAVIKVLSYDLPTDSFQVTEILETDTNGEALAQIVLNTKWYAFIVEVNGIVKLQTQPTKITSSSKILRIDLEDIQYFDRYDVTNGLTHSLTYTNSTLTFSFTWSDPTGESAEGCLKIVKRNVNSESILSDVCVVSSGGTINYAIVENTTNELYIATSYIKFSDGEIYILKVLEANFDEVFKKFGLMGVFVSFLLVITLVGIGIWSPLVAVLLAIFGVIIMSILGIFFVSWGVLMGLLIMGGISIYKLTRN